jgi:hypothetical protein
MISIHELVSKQLPSPISQPPMLQTALCHEVYGNKILSLRSTVWWDSHYPIWSKKFRECISALSNGDS